MGGMGGGTGRGGMGGMSVNGQGTRSKTLATLQGNDYVIVHKPGSDKVAAYSSEAGEWVSYEIPKGTDVVPDLGTGRRGVSARPATRSARLPRSSRPPADGIRST